MSKLKAFLQPSVAGTTLAVIVSDRFKDEEGKPQPFVIQAISQEENEALAEQCRKDRIIDGIPMKMLDDTAYSKHLMLACVKERDLKDSELCRYYGVVDPLDVLSKMLSIGEYQILTKEVMQINGLKSKQERLKEAKNS